MPHSKLKKRLKKTFKSLDRKRDMISSWLDSQGICLTDPLDYQEVARKAHTLLGSKRKNYYRVPGAMHATYSAILQKIHPDNSIKSIIKKSCLSNPSDRKETSIDPAMTERSLHLFYLSQKWRKLRYTALKAQGFVCLACGRSPAQGIILHVDHIKPIRKYWHLRLDPNNLQVLCEECNHGKGSWDETDLRQDTRLKP